MKLPVFLLLCLFTTLHTLVHSANDDILEQIRYTQTPDAIKDIEQALNLTPNIEYNCVTICNSTTVPMIAHIEGVNLCEIDPTETAISPIKLPFRSLTEPMIVNPHTELDFTYIYNVQQSNQHAQEFLLMYPRLFITRGIQSYRYVLPESERKHPTTVTLKYDEANGFHVSAKHNKPYKVRPIDAKITPNTRCLHFILFSAKYYNFNKRFMDKCTSYFLEPICTNCIDCDNHINIDIINTTLSGEMTF